jgi:hypothetical protein
MGLSFGLKAQRATRAMSLRRSLCERQTPAAMTPEKQKPQQNVTAQFCELFASCFVLFLF